MAQKPADSEEQLQTVLDNIPDIVWLKDENGVYLMVNEAFAKMCGRSKESVMGCLDSDLWPPELAEKYIMDDREIVRNGKQRLLEEIVVDGGGQKRWVETIKTPILDQHGKVTGTTGVARDISYSKQFKERMQRLNKDLENRVQLRTAELMEANEALKNEISERKETEKKLSENKSMLQTVFDGISEPVVFLDKNLHIKILNQAAMAYYALKDNPAYDGNTCYELLKGKTNPCEKCQVPTVLDDGMPRTFVRKGFMNTDRVEKMTVYPLQGAECSSKGCIIHIRDITDEKQMEQELIQADKMISLGVLVSGVAHEINNPNNLIMLNTPIFQEVWHSVLPILDAYYQENGDFNVGGLNYTEMRDATPKLLEGILGGSKRIMRIVQDLKDYARYQPGNVKEQVDINKCVKNAVSLVSNQINKVTKHFSVHYDESLPTLEGNRQRLEQVVINLLQNACHAISDPGKHIAIRTFVDPQSNMAAVEVKDEGSGIPTGHLARIMDPFFTTKQNMEGTGLGLSVSSKIVQDHGGRISVQTKEGEGSVFTILLPTEYTGIKIKVLVADDDDLIRALVTQVLQQQEHYAVVTASNGAEACLMLGSDPPQLLILDIKMPDMDGIEVCRQIQKTPSLIGVKVIIITGHHESYEAKVLASMGFTNILPKPFSPQKLMDMVEKITQKE
jgi:PAS domain S-box-containing protein